MIHFVVCVYFITFSGFSKKVWQNVDYKPKYPCLSEGMRYVVIDAGNKEGFIKDAGLVFSTKGTEDYHGCVTSRLFETWMQDELLPRLEKPSVIVLDNASYHSALVSE